MTLKESQRKKKDILGKNCTDIHSTVSSLGELDKLLFYVTLSSVTSTKDHCLLERLKTVKLGNWKSKTIVKNHPPEQEQRRKRPHKLRIIFQTRFCLRSIFPEQTCPR